MQKKNKSFFNLETTLEYAVKSFLKKDPGDIANKSGIEYNVTDNLLQLNFLNKAYTVKNLSGDIFTETGEKASVYTSIIILHYLNTADGTPLAGQWISFKELPGGQIYAEPFRNRALIPFIKTFGDNPQSFLEGAKKIGGFSTATGKNYSMVIPVLPRVPVNFILYPGDEEFPASANILLDRHAQCYLPTEDYAHLPGMIIREMTVI